MIYDKSIDIFPIGIQGGEVYDIVYLGDIIPNYINSPIPKILTSEYVFLFTTMLNCNKDSYYYGHVTIHLLKHESLSYFNNEIRQRGNMHVMGRENLKINDFLEIVQEETEQGKQIIAKLKNQNIIRNYKEIVCKKNFRILLVRENSKNFIDNIPLLEFGPEFSLKLECDRADERVDELTNTEMILSALIHRNNIKLEDSKTKNIKDMLEKEIEDARKKRDELFDKELRLRQKLLYIHKVSN